MNKKLQNIIETIQQSEKLDAEQKKNLIKAVQDADKEFEITAFKLDRTEKVKKTTAILLEETIEELEQKRKAVEAQNRELEIETSLERVRAVATGMKQPEDMIDVCRIISDQLEILGVTDIRNIQTAIITKKKGTYLNYEYFTQYKTTSILEIVTKLHPVVEEFAKEILKSKDAFFTKTFEGEALKDWIEYRKNTNQNPDPILESAKSVHYYFYSIGPGALGVSTYSPITDEEIKVFKRFRNVFELAYRRFIDIEKAIAQAREAQIEAALERVRAKSMAMHHTSELQEVVNTVAKQLHNLETDITGGVFITINNEVDKELIFWGSSGAAETYVQKTSIPILDRPIYTVLRNAIKKRKGFFVEDYTREEKKEFFKHLFKHPPYDSSSPEWKKQVLSREGGYTRSVAVSHHTTIFIINHQGRKFSNADNEILKRFGKVFEQSYTRFLDLQKAEEQAREAEIELALERVRARTMAMHKGAELADTALLLFEQITELGIKPRSCGFLIMDEESESMEDWSANVNEKGKASPVTGTLAFDQHPMLSDVVAAWRKGAPYFIGEIHGKDLQKYYKAVTSQESTSKAIKEKVLARANSEFTNSFNFGYGMMYVLTPMAISEHEIDIMLRFAKVFKQTYTRFLDLQKAEAQARESEIQLSLERIRAHTMAMNKSTDLKEVIQLLYQEFKSLGVVFNTTAIQLKLDDSRDLNLWSGTEKGLYKELIHWPYANIPVQDSTNQAWQTQDFQDIHYDKKEKDRFLTGFFKIVEAPEAYKNRLMDTEGLELVGYFKKEVGIQLLRYSSKPFRSDERDIVRRFTNSFEQSYTRFLDLQKAEAQAREAQIQLALERIRARTMAMQHSDELLETAQVLFQQFSELGENPDQLSIGIVNETERVIELGVSVQGVRLNRMYKVPIDEPVVINKIYDAWKKQKKSLVLDISGNELKKYKDFRNSSPEFKEYNVVKNSKSKEENRRVIYSAFFPKGLLSLATPEPRPEEAMRILERFANVFDLTYTRFLDLQKAEAQAREAQIEAALERVRSRSMAMHKSEQLSEVAKVLFEQFSALGKIPDRMSIGIVDEGSQSIQWWVTDQSGSQLKHGFTSPLKENRTIDNFYSAWKEGKESIVIELTGNELQEWLRFVREKVKMPIDDSQMKNRRVHQAAFLSRGVLLISTHEPVALEIIQILIRFARVFNQTYTRFLDLKKAEAQAREAQIEAALERVRSRTMAMHQSNELADTAAVLFKQLIDLGIAPNRLYIGIMKNKSGDVEFWITDEDGSKVSSGFSANLKENRSFKKMLRGWIENKKSITIDMKGKELQDYFQHLQKLHVPFKGGLSQKRRVQNIAYFSEGLIGLASPDLQPEETINLLERFAAVFNLTYQRFLDLQKAEAQAREAQIEAALERVRSRSMGMQKSEELKEVIQLVYEQFVHLNIDVEHTGFIMDYQIRDDLHIWLANQHEVPSEITIPCFDSTPNNSIKEAKENGQDFFTYLLTFKEKNKFYRDLFKFIPGVPEESLEYYFNCPGLAGSGVLLENVGLYIENFSGTPYTDEENKTLMRFGKVFQQTYTRFLDLQKAEAQAREAQIEAALERIRATSMAMHKTEDISNVVIVFFNQLKLLEIHFVQAWITVLHLDQGYFDVWFSPLEGVYDDPTHFQMPSAPFEDTSIKSWREGKSFSYLSFSSKKEVDAFLRVCDEMTHSNYFSHLQEQLKIEGLELVDANYKYGTVSRSGDVKATKEEEDILSRFAKVFEQTYTRFLDLQKAEEQAREAQIEAALEKVRGKAMGMHSSEDISDTMGVVFTELPKLGIGSLRCGVVLLSKDSFKGVFYAAATTTESDSQTVIGEGDMSVHPIFMKQREHWTRNENYFVTLSDDDLKSYYKEIFRRSSTPYSPKGHKIQKEHGYYFSFSEGMFYAWSEEPYSESDINILERFKAIIDLTFRRYIDLKKAEAQAREAKIEAALERVRTRAMAMHNSDDVGNATAVMFSELDKLGIVTIRCGILIIDNSESFEVWAATTSKEGKVVQVMGKLSTEIHPLLQRVSEAWKRQEQFFSHELTGKELQDYYTAISSAPDYHITPPETSSPTQFSNVFFFKEGGLFAYTSEPFQEEAIQILKKFAAVFALTYRRFLDLQKAEAQAKEAIKQASLDRVRGEIASMRTSEDLNRITPIIWHELETLEVPFIRCGVFIVDEDNKEVRVYLTTPDGKSLGALNLSFDSNDLTSNTVKHWKKNQVYKEHWNKEEFINWTKSMMEIGQVQNAETYQGSATPPESLNLHFVPFTQGMLYVGDISPLTDEKLDLVRTLADAFSIAYARYEDFKNIEEAKNKIEITLKELKSTQAQLIHSEKLASLGELTAGIAHEIKNPLNFVNNFSEVSRELLGEMKEELQNKNDEEVIVIIEDLKQNLERINQHGKRADSIVKGMLLHSRGTSGEKMLTDINNLLDEYVNLAYHGMRAQNSEFNITMEKDYDKSLEKINVVPQDISRVFMNIISNACYAAFDRKKTSDGDFEPVLKVSTKNLNGKVEIRIGDNGNGIPADILDKIFQPFFTTKPTGEGTGLGLSLSYDIVTKVHGGELRVETEEGEGSEFIIHLPLN